jgi:tetratricopeptide (TPR) repeat protein
MEGLMHKKQRLHLALVSLLLIPIALMQLRIDHQRRAIGLSSSEQQFINGSMQLPSNMLGAALTGFREPVASLLWVKADELFHTGKFEEVVPLMRVVTMLDPHMLDVYATGSWHLDFNFVDKKDRSDRRLIPSALEFLEQGIKNNPNVYDLYFEMAFTHYTMKIRDPERAIYWTKKTIGKKTSDGDPTPRFVYHTLAHSYETNGELDKCLEVWKERRDLSKRQIEQYKKAHHSKSDSDPRSDEALAEWEYDIASKNYDRVFTRRILRRDLVNNQINVNLESTIKKKTPRDLILNGKIDLPDGTRVDVYLRDVDWKERAKKDFAWRLDNQTLFQDSAAVYQGKFQMDIDLTDGEKFYPLKSNQYELVLEVNPRLEPAETQDKIGWNGEGFANQKYLDTSVPGLRKLHKRIILPLSEII